MLGRYAHLPVSPEVAPTTVNCSFSSSFLSLFLLSRKYAKTLPKNCNATSLKAHVGPCHSSITYSLSPVWRRGVVRSARKVAYDLLMSSFKSDSGMSDAGMKSDKMA